MKKINLELGRVSKGMRLKFSLILDSTNSQGKPNEILSRFHIDGNDYFKLNPHPFITIDISDSYDKNEAWSINKSVNLNFQGKMNMEHRLNIVIRNFQIKNLFYYNQYGKLTVNEEIVTKMNYQPFVIGNKTCVIKYAVIPDEKTKDVEYEGIIFMINSPDNFCYLTFEEVRLLQYMLENINMMELCMQVLIYYNSIKETTDDDIIEIKPTIITEEEDLMESPVIPLLEEPHTIPDL